jgi:hypothetical protein
MEEDVPHRPGKLYKLKTLFGKTAELCSLKTPWDQLLKATFDHFILSFVRTC